MGFGSAEWEGGRDTVVGKVFEGVGQGLGSF